MSSTEQSPDEQLHETLRWSTLGRLGPALVVLVVAVVLPYLVPGLERARPWTSDDPVPFWNLLGRPFEGEEQRAAEQRHDEVAAFAREVLAEPEPTPLVQPDRPVIELDPGEQLPAYVPRPEDQEPIQRPIELFEGHELDRFFAALARTDAGLVEATTRVVHWGDSAIGLDGIPGAIRRRMQARFGDAGHGFHLLAPPNTSYRHREVAFRHNEAWELCFIIRRCKDDGRYGLGGATFWSTGGAQSRFAPHPERSSGRVGRFEVWYMAGPRSGRLKVRVDDQDWQVIDTRSEQVEDRWHAIEVDDGFHELTVRAGNGGQTRLYGVTLEREVPGVVWDGLALVGAFTNRLGELDEEHLRAQLEHRQANLAVLMFGGNDMIRATLTQEQYEQEYREVIRKLQRAAPELDCLIMSPLDHGVRRGVRIVSQEIVPTIVAAQRNVAESEGCGFFNTYEAMGGEGSAGRWFKQRPQLIGGDLSHATAKGHAVIGEMFYRALVHAYVDYREREQGSGQQ